MNHWKSIWDGKSMETINLDKNEFEVFCDLKKADGFDVSVGNENIYYMSFYHEWQKMYKNVSRLVKRDIKSIYEVGCGSGVNLFLFQNRIGKDGRVGGIDYSANLINIAERVIESNDLTCGEAIDLDESEKYDLVMADSVFQYFENIDYAEAVLRKMLHKANKLVYIGEMHDDSLKEEWLENRRKSMKNYDEVYKGLSKQFYSKKWVESIAKKFNKKVYFTSSDNSEYWNSKYIFNCYIYTEID